MAKQKQMRKKEKKTVAVKPRKERKSSLFSSLITKTVIAFVLLILIIVLQGTMSYSSAKDMLIEEAESTLVTTVKAKSDYIGLGMEQVSDRMIEILTSDDVMYYYINGTIDYAMLDDEQSKVKTRIQENLRNLKQISDFVYQLYFFNSKTIGHSTTPLDMTKEYYKNFIASEEGNYMNTTADKYGYFGKHPYLDEQITK